MNWNLPGKSALGGLKSDIGAHSHSESLEHVLRERSSDEEICLFVREAEF